MKKLRLKIVLKEVEKPQLHDIVYFAGIYSKVTKVRYSCLETEAPTAEEANIFPFSKFKVFKVATLFGIGENGEILMKPNDFSFLFLKRLNSKEEPKRVKDGDFFHMVEKEVLPVNVGELQLFSRKDLEHAFNAARETDIKFVNEPYLHETFNDYLKSIR